MTDLLRYPVVLPHHPPPRVRVVVCWNGRTFQAARVIHPCERRWCWVRRHADGREQYLPPRLRKGIRAAGKAKAPAPRPAAEWLPNPEWWQPIDPAKWQAPLPNPLPPPLLVQPDTQRMVNIRARRRPAETAKDRAVEDGAPWWWDASAIVYEPPGAVTPRMAEGRLMRALAAPGAVGAEAAPRRQRDYALASIADARAEAEREAALSGLPPRDELEPGPADLADWLTAMAWFAALDPPELRARGHLPWMLTIEQKVLAWRAQRRSWASIALMVRRSRTWGRDAAARSLARVTRIANGVSPDPHRRSRDAMAALSERNRAHHNREASAP